MTATLCDRLAAVIYGHRFSILQTVTIYRHVVSVLLICQEGSLTKFFGGLSKCLLWLMRSVLAYSVS